MEKRHSLVVALSEKGEERERVGGLGDSRRDSSQLHFIGVECRLNLFSRIELGVPLACEEVDALGEVVVELSRMQEERYQTSEIDVVARRIEDVGDALEEVHRPAAEGWTRMGWVGDAVLEGFYVQLSRAECGGLLPHQHLHLGEKAQHPQAKQLGSRPGLVSED